jgi:RNA polymerase sigma-70 factor (ECF subfamily)
MKNNSHNLEETLMASLKAGDIDALGKLYEMFSTCIFKYSLRIMASKQAAEDITQDVFLNIWKYRENYMPENRFKAWAMRICLNLCRDRRKSFEGRNISLDENHLHQPDHSSSPEETVESAQILERMAIAFNRLPEAFQQILAIRFDGDLNITETALALGCSIRTVHYQTAQAIENLRKLAEGVQNENA